MRPEEALGLLLEALGEPGLVYLRGNHLESFDERRVARALAEAHRVRPNREGGRLAELAGVPCGRVFRPATRAELPQTAPSSPETAILEPEAGNRTLSVGGPWTLVDDDAECGRTYRCGTCGENTDAWPHPPALCATCTLRLLCPDHLCKCGHKATEHVADYGCRGAEDACPCAGFDVAIEITAGGES